MELTDCLKMTFSGSTSQKKHCRAPGARAAEVRDNSYSQAEEYELKRCGIHGYFCFSNPACGWVAALSAGIEPLVSALANIPEMIACPLALGWPSTGK